MENFFFCAVLVTLSTTKMILECIYVKMEFFVNLILKGKYGKFELCRGVNDPSKHLRWRALQQYLKPLTIAAKLSILVVCWDLCFWQIVFQICQIFFKKKVQEIYVLFDYNNFCQLYFNLKNDRALDSVASITPAGNHMFKVNNRNTRTKCEICSKLTIKILEWRQWRR